MQKSKTTLRFKRLIYLLLIFSLGLSFYKNNFLAKKSSYSGNEAIIKGTVIDYKKTSDKFTMTILTINNGKKEKIIANIYNFEDSAILKNKNSASDVSTLIKIGDSITLKGSLKEPLNNTIPNTFNYKKYLYYKEIYYLFTVKEIVKLEPSSNILYKLQNLVYERCMKIDNKGYLTMLIYGKKAIDADIYSALQDLGVVHLFAISGLHISIFTLVMEKILKKLPLKNYLRTIIVVAFLSFYAALISFPASVLRALTMYILLKIAEIIQNKLQIELKTYEVLLLSIAILLLINSYLMYDIGFLYSSLCTFGLIYYNDKTKNYFLKSLKTSYIASLWSLPISISLNYSYNLLSPVFNIFYVPFISFIFYPVCLLTFIFPSFGPILRLLIVILENLSTFFTRFSLNIILPKMSISIIIIYYLNIFLLSKYKKTYFHLLNILILLIYPWQYNLNKNLMVYYLDVLQGDASILISPRKKEVTMIDTGGLTNDENYYTAKNIIKFLHSINIKKIDNLIISHGDFDHIGNAFYLVNNIKVEKVIFNNNEFNELETNLIKILQDKKIEFQKGDSNLQGEYFTWQFLNTRLYDNENDNSLVTYLKYQDYTFLFMGDASILKEEDVIKKYKLTKIDFLKVGHHGSRTSSSKEFISKINPQYSIISVGRNNKYGHPNKKVLNNLDNSKIYRTDQNGSIMLKIKDNKLEIETYSP